MIVTRRRILAAGLSAVTVLAGLVVAAAPATATTSVWCSQNGDTTPCVDSATVQVGTAATETLTPSSTDYYPVLQDCTDAVVDDHCTGSVAWAVADGYPDSYSLSTNVTLTLDLGTYVPSENDIFGVNADVTRSTYGRHSYKETISGQPSDQDEANCTENASVEYLCDEQASKTIVFFNGLVDDSYNYGLPDAQAAASYGLDDWTTSEATGPPLFLASTPAGTMTIPIGNSHLHADGSVVVGQYNAVLPNALLEYEMGIDDPSTITSSSIAVSLQSGTVLVTPGTGNVDLNISNITWPEAPGAGASVNRAGADAKRAADKPLRVTPGVITPSRAVKVHARRSSATVGRFTFSGAKPRGSKITHYQASCAARHHPSRSGTSKSRKKLRVHKLARGTAYSCKVRAVSKAGHGRWSKAVAVKR